MAIGAGTGTGAGIRDGIRAGVGTEVGPGIGPEEGTGTATAAGTGEDGDGDGDGSGVDHDHLLGGHRHVLQQQLRLGPVTAVLANPVVGPPNNLGIVRLVKVPLIHPVQARCTVLCPQNTPADIAV